MKQIIRLNTFETNSSSTHSLCICTKEEYEKFVCGELCYDTVNEKLVSKAQIIAEYEKDCSKYGCSQTLDEWIEEQYETEKAFRDIEDYEYKTFMKTYTTQNGEELVVFGYFRYDY